MAASQSPKQKVNMLPDTPISLQLLWSREGLQLGWRVKKPSSELREAYCPHTPCEPEDSGQSAHLPRVPLLTLLGASVMGLHLSSQVCHPPSQGSGKPGNNF